MNFCAMANASLNLGFTSFIVSEFFDHLSAVGDNNRGSSPAKLTKRAGISANKLLANVSSSELRFSNQSSSWKA